jgi:hypothetical protein
MPRSRKATIDLKVRMKEPLRAAIEKAAKARGVSLNRETVARLEKSFHMEQAEESSLGGSEIAPLIRILGATVELLEQRTGGKVLEDWRTGLAVSAAWKRVATQFFPKVPTGEIKAFDDPIPERPIAPVPPTFPPISLLTPQSEVSDATEAYAQESRRFKKVHAKFLRDVAKYDDLNRVRDERIQKELDRFTELDRIGRDAAVEVLSEGPKGD